MSSDMEVLLVRQDSTQKWGLIQAQHHEDEDECTIDSAINLLVDLGFIAEAENLTLKSDHPDGWLFELESDENPGTVCTMNWRWTCIEDYSNMVNNSEVNQATLSLLGTM